MGFLTPLYLLGAATIALPILFHMIRRTPRGRQEFSSVMFLDPSPPRITRRSRIEHWLLLLLRTAAVCLLALAFARPFFRHQQIQPLTDPDARQFAILVDTSASMRRAGLWTEAVEQVRAEVGDAGPLDEVCLITFDRQPRMLINFEQWNALEAGQRVESVGVILGDIDPTWHETNLGLALILAADVLDEAEARHVSSRTREIVLVSDLQAGSHLEALQSYQWPKEVNLRVAVVGEDASPSNAAIHPLAERGENADDSDVRVRITNAENSRVDQFQIGWDKSGFDSGETDADTLATVAPGESRVMRVPARSGATGGSRLVLEGDDHDFDNRCYVHRAPVRTMLVGVLSGDAPDDPEGMRYYIEPALPATSTRVVRVVDWKFEDDRPDELVSPNLIILTDRPLPVHVEALRSYLDGGGTVLFVPTTAEDCGTLYELLNVEPAPVTEAEVESYAMLNEIDFSHPLFSPLADPRFSDFTKLHVWHHRRIDAESLKDARILAQFDDGDPAILEVPRGMGNIVVWATGWQPEDSQLALSTKFIPMMNSLLESAAGLVEQGGSHHVGAAVSLADLAAPGETVSSIVRPDGASLDMRGQTEFTATDEPGMYRAVIDVGPSATQTERAFAVNLSASESRTEPLVLDVLETSGVQLTGLKERSEITETMARQLRARELEGRQKTWRWMVLLVIVLLLIETWVAGRLSRRVAN